MGNFTMIEKLPINT